MNQTIKKSLYLICTIILGISVLVSGCGSSGGDGNAEKENSGAEKEVATVLDGFFKTMQSGDFSRLTEYCTEDVLASLQLDGLDAEALESTFYDLHGLESMGLSFEDLDEESKEAIMNAERARITNWIESYEMSDISVNRKTAEVTGTVTYGYDTAYEIDAEGFMAEYKDSFSTEQISEYAELYANEGEEALKKKMVNDMLPGLMEKYSSSLLATEGVSDTLEATVTKTDGKWIITALNIHPVEETGVSE